MISTTLAYNSPLSGRTGRVGNVGKATSFYDAEQDNEVAGPLVQMLTAAGIAVPDWLAEAGAGGGGGGDGEAAAGGDDDEDWG
jgi:hypothetical protein